MNNVDFKKCDLSELTEEVSFKGTTVKIKKYLSTDQCYSIVQTCVYAYENGAETTEADGSKKSLRDDTYGFDKSPITTELLFWSLLIQMCTDIEEGYDLDYLIATGFIDFLKDEVVNADQVWDWVLESIDRKYSIEHSVEKALFAIVEKLPSSEELEKLYSKVKKDITSEKFSKMIEKAKDIMDIDKKRSK
jgi:hypothetical protein